MSIKDVAKLAGVSIATVSNVLSGRKNVSEEKRRAVLSAVSELGYVPNINARLLKSRRTGNIGLFLPFIDGPFYPALLQEVFHACADHGYDMFAHVAKQSDSRRTAATMLSCNIDAAIVLNDHLLDRDISILAERGLPLVFLDRELRGKGVGSVVLDNAHGITQEIEYLRHTGHTRVACLRGRDNYDGDTRFAAFLRGMAAAGLAVDEALIMNGLFEAKVAYNCVHMLYAQALPRPDAILCANDEMAIGCMEALRDLHYAVPQDVSVLGFDNLGAEACAPPLTTVAYSMGEFARMAVEEALRLIEDPQSEGRLAVLPTEIRIRDSVAFRCGNPDGSA